jgi:2-oxoisovalerate dehydrogenase E2 component (dihydrolipoyl transacylase)
MSVKQFALPDLGEGLTESEVVAWRVAVGESVELNQVIAEVETAKALVEVPSPFEGIVHELFAEPGQTLQVGAPLVAFEVPDADGPLPQDSPIAEPAASALAGAFPEPLRDEASRPEPVERTEGSPSPQPAASQSAASQSQEVLVGRIPLASGARPQRRARSGRLDEPIVRQRAFHTATAASVDTRHAEREGADPPSVPRRTETAPAASRETVTPVAGVRRRTAEAMVRSAAVPQVTEFLTIDVTRSMRLLDRLASRPAFRDRHLSVLTLASRALCLALERTPAANTHWRDGGGNEGAGELVDPGTVNLGIAVATRRGLVVPNIRDAQRLDLGALADALAELVERARSGRSTPAGLTGGTITITNVGVFGVDSGTPLLNPGETAILAMGAVTRRPWEHRGRVELRQIMTLSLTFDHRVIDGEQGSRLLADIGLLLADPAQAMGF